MGTSCHILGCLSGKEKKNLKMQALGLGMCPVIIHIRQEREFRLCFVTLRCGIGRSSQENHTCLQGNKLSNQNSESKASQPAFSSKRPTTRVDNVQLLRNTVPEVWPLSGGVGPRWPSRTLPTWGFIFRPSCQTVDILFDFVWRWGVAM